ncbi:MAG: carbohydrate ABC transporter permease [Oscillospiraceae bacterium]|jgi:putative aldouronate transport system permease protein|nr:carbohydrate ABC transporter permease [Oscillospiraceae bacterium]
MAKKKKVTVFDVINITAMVLIGLIMLLPILNLASKAFSSEGHVIAGNVLFWPKEFQLDTVKYVLATPEFGNAFLVTVTITICGTAAAMLLTVLAAYPLSKPYLKGRKFFLYIFVFIMLFSAGMVPNYILYRSLHLTNTLFALMFPGMLSSFNLFLIKNYFESLPEVIEEAARIDGASNSRIFFSVVLPMSLPVLATVTLFYAVGYWSSYFSGVMYITDAKLKPLQQYMFDLITEATSLQDASGSYGDIDKAMNVSGENVRAATIVVSTIPILCVYPFLQKYFVKGITIGSVKG